MIKTVLDTNIIFSAIFWKGNPYKAVKALIRKEYQHITSREILDELIKILREVEWEERSINRWERLILRNSILIKPNISLNVIKEDTEDNKFIECAVSGKADYLITGDKHLLKIKKYQKVEIIKVKEFLELIGLN